MQNLNEPLPHPLIGEAAPDAIVARAPDGQDFALAELWRGGPAVLVFLRHFG